MIIGKTRKTHLIFNKSTFPGFKVFYLIRWMDNITGKVNKIPSGFGSRVFHRRLEIVRF